MDVDVDLVRRDLTASVTAHLAARMARSNGDLTHARELLADAAAWRQMAHSRDPEHTAPAWAEEQKHSPNGKDTHTEMVRFYQTQGVWNG